MDDSTKLTRVLNKIFLALCCAATLALAIMFVVTDCARVAPALLCAALCGGFYAFCRLAEPRLSGVSSKKLCAAFYVALALWLALSLVAAIRNLPSPRGDYEAIHTGVKEAVELGRLTDSNPYFLRYSHQRGTLMTLSLFFYILQRLGICATVSVSAGAVLIRVGAAAALALIFDAARRIWGAPRALASGLLMLISPTLFNVRSYYSISLGIPLAALAAWLYVIARLSMATRVRRAALYALCGGAFAVASVVSGTVYVFVAATVIHLFLTCGGFKSFIKRLAALALGFALFFAGFQGAIRYGGVIDFTDEQKELLPLGYWFMVALKDDGLYNEDDYQYIVSLPDYDARAEYAKGEISRLLRERTPAELVAHALNKNRITLTQGGYSGAGTSALAAYTAAFGSFLALLWLAGSINAVRLGGPAAHTLWLLVCFGLFMFFCLWEAKPGAQLTLLPELCVFGSFALFPKSDNDGSTRCLRRRHGRSSSFLLSEPRSRRAGDGC